MATTSGDNLFSPDSVDQVDGIVADLAAMQGSTQTALDYRAIRSYKPASATALAAITGMSAGDIAYQLDTNTEYRYSGSAWVRTGVAFVANSAYANGSAAIASASYATLPTIPVSLSITATSPCMAVVTWNCRGSAAAGYINVGVAVSGATTIAANESAPGVTPSGVTAEYVNTIIVQVTASKLVSLNAGTNTFTIQALLGGAGGTKTIYHPYMTVIPVAN